MWNRFISWLKSLKKRDEPMEEPKPEAPVYVPPTVNEEIPPLPTSLRVKDVVNDGNPVKPDWSYLWDNCVVDLKAKAMLDSAVKKFIDNRAKYQYVEKITGVPDWFIAGLHMREASFNFNGCLHNGDPWNKKTKNVPKGRGPWGSWAEAAVDALNFDNITAAKVATIELCLEFAFRFNGVGYKKRIGDHGEIEYSPYVVAYTNWHDETSKYENDGDYNPNAKEEQLGVMAFWKELDNHGLIKVA